MKLTLKPDEVIREVPCATCLAAVGHPCVLLIAKPHGAPMMGWPHFNRRIWAQKVVNRRRRIEEAKVGAAVLIVGVAAAVLIGLVVGPIFHYYILELFFPVPDFTPTQLETL